MGHLTLITGGARSGKSSFAEQQILLCGEKIAYIATAHPFDREMEDRIARHKEQRPSAWQTFEEPLAPSRIIRQHASGFDGILLDCLTVMTTNIILQESDVDWQNPSIEIFNDIELRILQEIELLLEVAESFPGHLFVVTNEVGLGIVPDNPLSRFFRDCSGRVNQKMAAAANEVYFVVSGLPMQIKGQAAHA